MKRLPATTKGPIRGHAIDQMMTRRSQSHDGDHIANVGAFDESMGIALKLLRFPAVRERTGLSRSTIWRLERQGAFPRHHRISANAVAWVEDDIAKWIQSKVAGIAV
jgi:prophage regulatory protein